MKNNQDENEHIQDKDNRGKNPYENHLKKVVIIILFSP